MIFWGHFCLICDSDSWRETWGAEGGKDDMQERAWGWNHTVRAVPGEQWRRPNAGFSFYSHILMCLFQFYCPYISILSVTRILKCLMSRHCCVKRLFPIRAIVINLCGCDNSAMFSVRLLRKCAFSRLICLTHSFVLGSAILTAPESGKFSGSHINTLFMTRECQSLLYRLAVKQHVKDFEGALRAFILHVTE